MEILVYKSILLWCLLCGFPFSESIAKQSSGTCTTATRCSVWQHFGVGSKGVMENVRPSGVWPAPEGETPWCPLSLTHSLSLSSLSFSLSPSLSLSSPSLSLCDPVVCSQRRRVRPLRCPFSLTHSLSLSPFLSLFLSPLSL